MAYLQTSHLSRALSCDRYRSHDLLDDHTADDYYDRTRRSRSVGTYYPYLKSDYSGYYRYLYDSDKPYYRSPSIYYNRLPYRSLIFGERIKPSYLSSLYFPSYSTSKYRFRSPLLYSSYEPLSRYHWDYYSDMDDWIYRTRYCTGLGYLRAMRPLYSSIINNRLDYLYPTYDSPSYRRGLLSYLGYNTVYSPSYSRWL
ncbi:hypothetical protein GJ496_006881 [Pomphorhynchus laevis]|nr:hypothetical protein GJ496_006881 [Pomphorhynchus laevis]